MSTPIPPDHINNCTNFINKLIEQLTISNEMRMKCQDIENELCKLWNDNINTIWIRGGSNIKTFLNALKTSPVASIFLETLIRFIKCLLNTDTTTIDEIINKFKGGKRKISRKSRKSRKSRRTRCRYRK